MFGRRRAPRTVLTVALRRGEPRSGRPGGSAARRRTTLPGGQRPAGWVLLALVFVTGSLAALFAGGGHVERRGLEGRRDAANVELDRQLRRVHELRREVRHLDGDSLARERLAREELGYTRRGEMVFLLAEPEPQPQADEAP